MIAIGADHAGFALKEKVKQHLIDAGYEVKDYGTYSEERCNYPVFGKKVADAVASGECEQGVLVCGTGVGISLAANKVKGIRAGVCSDATTARLIKQHNNANIVAFGARIVGEELAYDIVDAFLHAEFLGGRHAERVALIEQIEEENFK
ncbi:MAG: ribose 5-phosphate isomerase B [Lachnospiraceae bacterium]|nr:ribose 5-phosphate isomerase B [Lachnospiraceae bacterium]